jgi:hypothetical protein
LSGSPPTIFGISSPTIQASGIETSTKGPLLEILSRQRLAKLASGALLEFGLGRVDRASRAMEAPRFEGIHGKAV